MAKVRILPHLEAAGDAIIWGPWWVRINGQRKLAGKRVDNWDYATPVSFELQPSVDPELLLESTGLESLVDIDVVLLIECSSTGNRFTTTRNLASLTDAQTSIVAIEPSSAQMALSVVLTAHLVMARTTVPTSLDTAYKHGSRLASSARETVLLEGDSPRFPTEAVSFSALGLEKALWDLDISFADLSEPFLSGVRLLVNAEHPSAEMLLDDEDAGFLLAHSALELDIVRRLILRVAADEGLRDDLASSTWQDGSVRAVLEELADTFLASDLNSIVELSRHDPRRFERRLQHRFELFGRGA